MEDVKRSERDRVDAALRRSWHVQRFDPDLESSYAEYFQSKRKKQVLVTFCMMLVVLATSLALDASAGCLRPALILKSTICAPLLITSSVFILFQCSERSKSAARSIAVSSIVLVTMIVGDLARSPFDERYLIMAGLLCFSINFAMLLTLREAMIQAVMNLTIYLGVPMSGLARHPSSVDIVAGFGLLTLISMRFVRDRERSDRNEFLLRSRDRILQSEMKALIDELTVACLTDALTGVSNRRGFDLKCENVIRRAEGHGCPMSVILIDVDHFKAFNDTAGHLAGDRCLRMIADSIVAAVDREKSSVSRYGGEEFAVVTLLGHTEDDRTTSDMAERIRTSVESSAICNPGLSGRSVTISLGFSTMRPISDEITPAMITRSADEALYLAKKLGRNRAISSGELKHMAAA